MSGVARAISALPLLARAKLVGITTYPGLGLHEAATLTAALGVFNKKRASLAGVIALFTNLGRDFAMAHCLTRCLQ